MKVGTRAGEKALCTIVVCTLGFSLPQTMSAQQNAVNDTEKTATVQILVFRDKPIDVINGLLVLQFQQEHGKIDLANKFIDGFRKDKATGIPFGTYKARVYLDGFWGAVDRTVEVAQPKVLVVIDERTRASMTHPADGLVLSWGSLGWPELEGPHCVRSKCYIDVMDALQR